MTCGVQQRDVEDPQAADGEWGENWARGANTGSGSGAGTSGRPATVQRWLAQNRRHEGMLHGQIGGGTAASVFTRQKKKENPTNCPHYIGFRRWAPDDGRCDPHGRGQVGRRGPFGGDQAPLDAMLPRIRAVPGCKTPGITGQ